MLPPNDQSFHGTLLPLTSLPSFPNNWDQDIDQFFQWLTQNNQNAWQVLPVHQTPYLPNSNKRLTSPYSSYGIGLNPSFLNPELVNIDPDAYEQFLQQCQSWLPTYSLFCSLSDYYQTDNWTNWPTDMQRPSGAHFNILKSQLRHQIEQHNLQQFRLYQQFKELKERAKQAGIKLIGDAPFYNSLESPLVWQNQQLFQFNRYLQMDYESGVPAGKHFGRQAWGHPLYSWDPTNTDQILDLWKIRLTFLSQFFHYIRIDHSIGFYTTGKMHHTNPKKDTIMPGPGDYALHQLIQHCKNLNCQLILEDLTSFKESQDKLHQIMAQEHIPGQLVITQLKPSQLMSLLHKKPLPYPAIIYTSTHDTETLLTWSRRFNVSDLNRPFSNTSRFDRSTLNQLLSQTLNLPLDASAHQIASALRNFISQNYPQTIIPIQDHLLTEDRINIPGTVNENNWKYKLKHLPLTQLET